MTKIFRSKAVPLPYINQLIQCHCFVGDRQIDELLHVIWMVKVQNLVGAIVLFFDVIKKNFNYLLQKQFSLRPSIGVVGENV